MIPLRVSILRIPSTQHTGPSHLKGLWATSKVCEVNETRTEREPSQGSTHSQGGGGGVGGDSLERQSSTRGVGVRGVWTLAILR